MKLDEFRITLEAARVNAGLSQKEVANLLGITAQTVGNYESGKTKKIPVGIYDAMCDLYRVPKDILILP